MSRQLLINLPVSDPQKSKRFFEALGLSLNQSMTDENATCFDIADNIVLALLPAEHFKGAINNHAVADATTTNEVLLSIGVTSRGEVDAFATKAVAAGGREVQEPADLGWIYGRTFADLDGHQWNIFTMDQKEKTWLRVVGVN